MIKLIHNTFAFDEPTFQVVHPGMGMPLVKCASEMLKYMDAIKPKAGFTYALLLALGAGEAYGCNRNGDYFEAHELKDRHPTFETHGYVYRHHKNKDPNQSYGKVIKAYYNEPMMRVELLVEINNSKAPEEVKKINEGVDVPVSMAAKVPYDICSICGNRAKTREEYCSHLKGEMTRIYPDGKQVYALNPTPTFFDISFVFRPADRIAYVLKKVASVAEAVMPSVYLAEMDGLIDADYGASSPEVMRKLATLRKMSDIEKEVEGMIGKIRPRSAREKILMDEGPKALKGPCAAEDLNGLGNDPLKVLGGLAGRGIVLGPETFSKYLFGQETPGMQSQLPGIFSRLLASPAINGLLNSSLMDLENSPLSAGRSILDRLTAQHSMLTKPSARRILQITIVKPGTDGVNFSPRETSVSSAFGFGGGVLKSSSDHQDAERVATAYALYKLAAVSLSENQDDEMLPLLTVLQNYVT